VTWLISKCVLAREDRNGSLGAYQSLSTVQHRHAHAFFTQWLNPGITMTWDRASARDMLGSWDIPRSSWDYLGQCECI